MASNYKTKMMYEVDLVFCIDATCGMGCIWNLFRENALNFYQDFISVMTN